MKECSKCHKLKPESEYYRRRRDSSDGLFQQCKECMREQRKQYYQNHKEIWKKYYPKHNKQRKEKRLRYRSLVISHYGGKCQCCGESEYKFLTIDHINNDGAEHRKKVGIGRKSGFFLYKWLIKNNFPEGYQVLCWNCNCGKNMNDGICPHNQ